MLHVKPPDKFVEANFTTRRATSQVRGLERSHTKTLPREGIVPRKRANSSPWLEARGLLGAKGEDLMEEGVLPW